jgi:hypothetical protein
MLGAAFALVGCEPEDRRASPSAETPAVGGTWQLGGEPSRPVAGALTLEQSGNDLWGVLDPAAGDADLECEGYIGGNVITMTIIRTDDGGPLYLAGQASRRSMSGTWSDVNASTGGVWWAAKVE